MVWKFWKPENLTQMPWQHVRDGGTCERRYHWIQFCVKSLMLLVDLLQCPCWLQPTAATKAKTGIGAAKLLLS